jgi:tetratricopeptide (TPR) repeat protein
MNRRRFAHLASALLLVVVAAAGCTKTPAATPPPANIAPRYPEFAVPVVPVALKAPQDLRDRHDLAWRRLQAGDLRGATRDFNALLKQSQTFYPAEAGLGYALLADKEYTQAATRFGAALSRDDRYLPAWQGLADAQLGAGNATEAVAALERIVALDPKRESARARLELLKFRQVQALFETGRKDRLAGRLDDAQASLERALALSPSSALILRELALLETTRGALDAAEKHARQAVQVDSADVETHLALGTVLEAKGQYGDAAAAYGRAAALDPAHRARSEAMRDKAEMAAVPSEFRAVPTAPTVTRAEVAALIGTRLERLITKAPKRVFAVATDVRTHWAAPWILPVTQAGVMEISPNHTFQPAALVRRDHLAQIVGELLALAATSRPAEFEKWKAARPKFADIGVSHAFYRAAALAVSAGAMTAHSGERFAPTRPATGQEVMAALTRIEQIAGR